MDATEHLKCDLPPMLKGIIPQVSVCRAFILFSNTCAVRTSAFSFLYINEVFISLHCLEKEAISVLLEQIFHSQKHCNAILTKNADENVINTFIYNTENE